MLGKTKDFLDQFRLYHTEDADEARQIVRDRFGADLTIANPSEYFAKFSAVILPNLHIYYSTSSSKTCVAMSNSPSTTVHLILHGRCGMTSGAQRVEVTDGEAYVCSQGQPASLDYETDYEKLVVMVPPAMLERTFTSLTGFAPKCTIVFEPLLDTGDPRYGGLRELVMLLAGRLDPAFSVWPQATLEQLEVACVTSLLFCGRHNLSHLLAPAPCSELPRHVRVAEHFAEVNADRDVGIDEMAQACGVSASTLTRGFLKHRGCTPAAYVKRTRLAHAKALLESRTATTVAGVALRCGFSNPSRFGKDYTQVFGETPTQTLRRLRAQPDA